MSNSFWIFESELKAIAFESSEYDNLETGGDLYGLWSAWGEPVIYLALGSGPNASKKHSEYEMDIEYMKECERVLQANHGIHYLGDWHSHHNLMLHKPSLGDQRRIQSLLRKNSINNMAEIIVTHILPEKGKRERINAFTYKGSKMNHSKIRLLESKISPIRESIMLNQKKYLKLNMINGKIPLNNIQINFHDKNGSSNYPSMVQSHETKLNSTPIKITKL